MDVWRKVETCSTNGGELLKLFESFLDPKGNLRNNVFPHVSVYAYLPTHMKELPVSLMHDW